MLKLMKLYQFVNKNRKICNGLKIVQNVNHFEINAEEILKIIDAVNYIQYTNTLTIMHGEMILLLFLDLT